MSHRKLVGYRFHLLQIHICLEDVMFTWSYWKAARGQRVSDGGYGWHKWQRQWEWVKWNLFLKIRRLTSLKISTVWTFVKLIDVFASLLYIPSYAALVICDFLFLLFWYHDLPILVSDPFETLTFYCCYLPPEYNNVSPFVDSSIVLATFISTFFLIVNLQFWNYYVPSHAYVREPPLTI